MTRPIAGLQAWLHSISNALARLASVIAIVAFVIPTASATVTDADQKPAAIALPSSLPVQRDVDASFTNGNISGMMVVGIILLGALLFYIRLVLYRKRKGHHRSAAIEKTWSKWLGAGNDNDGLRIVCSKALSSSSRLHVIEWGGQRYLLAQNDHAFTLLDKIGGDAADRIHDVRGETP